MRYWAKKRGLYANKMGYLGGVNWNIMSAFICQLYPNAAPSLLLERFFFILRDWKWPTPILLTPQYDAGLSFETWDPSFGGNRFHCMPILTPAVRAPLLPTLPTPPHPLAAFGMTTHNASAKRISRDR